MATLIVVGLAVAFLVAGIVDVRRFRPSASRTSVIFLASILLRTLGAATFLGPFAAAMGLVPFVDERTEFPVGRPDMLLRDSLGHQIAAVRAASRVQVYDSHGRFVRGWFVDAAGGTFTLRLTRAGFIEVRAARTDRVMYYTVDGVERRNVSFADAQTVYSATGRPNVRFGYPWWQWPLSHPYAAFLLLALGTLGARRFGPERSGAKVREGSPSAGGAPSAAA